MQRASEEVLTTRIKRKWLGEHDADIRAQDGDPEEAYQAWCQGRIDELASAYESEVIDSLAELVLEDE